MQADMKLTRLRDQSPTKRAVVFAGGVTEIARALGITPQAVSGWLRRDKIPSKWVLAIENLIEGEVPRFELRPDLYPAPDLELDGRVSEEWLHQNGYLYVSSAPPKKKRKKQ
jgi:DNA-binding transcriptional regulator YdaS (Cro superfamily)